MSEKKGAVIDGYNPKKWVFWENGSYSVASTVKKP
jgi:hypothetical protein